MKLPPRMHSGDKVAILSPSSDLASVFPHVYELGLKRLHDVFQLEPVEFPVETNPQVRAEQINAAFKDPSIKAIIATIGGNDQIQILPFLNPDIIQKNPKIFLGYSDNTSLHLYLWNLGMISYYGGNLMNQFAMQGQMHDFTVQSLKKALFETEIGEIHPAAVWTDFDLDWSDPQTLNMTRPLYKGDGWQWHNNENQIVEGKLWGGCLESLDMHLSLRHYLPPIDHLAGAVLYLETSEEMPSESFVYRFITTLAELGILQKFKAILFGRPKAQFCGAVPPEGREAFIESQQRAVKSALQDSNCNTLVVFNLNFGHTDPQLIIPNGGIAKIDGLNKVIYIH